jgi:hypothetical protein
MISSTIQSLTSIDQVVTLINQNGDNEFDGAQYAAQCILSSMTDEQNFSDEAFSDYYDLLERSGAKMDFEDVQYELRQIEPQ